jgi:hypothetical protein
MTIPGSANPLLLASAAAEDGYQIERSLRFNSADSAYLSRTPASAGNRKTWTWAGWVKRSALGAGQKLLSVNTASNNANAFNIDFTSGDLLSITASSGNADIANLTTSQVFRDPSSWYHIVIACDTAQATSSNRLKVFVNGTQVTAFGTASYPTQNTDFQVNNNVVHYIGRLGYTSVYLNAYLADIHFIDGQALDHTSFGEFDTNGIWQPKAYTGSYGTNGFHLDFADNSTAAALGTDTSGNSNTWTVNNISVTAGAGNDSLVDVPTNGAETDTGVGGEVRGNYATWNPLIASAGLSNGNLDLVAQTSQSTIGVASGKWYCEYTIVDASLSFGPRWGFSNFNSSVSAVLRAAAGRSASVGGVSVTLSGHSSSITSGTIGIALNLDANECKIYHNNQLRLTATGIPAGVYFFLHQTDGSIDEIRTNFGQRPFAYTAPSGFKALNTANLPAGTITTSGSFTGNANADGPFVWLNGVPTSMTINNNAVTFGTHADKLANGFKVRSSSGSYNTAGSNTYSITATGDNFNVARAQPNP